MKLVASLLTCLFPSVSGADAVLAYKAGVEGIVVSNHGGRNCDTARPTLQVLYEVMEALRGIRYDKRKFDVYLDGGIKRGGDIFKAVALGKLKCYINCMVGHKCIFSG